MANIGNKRPLDDDDDDDNNFQNEKRKKFNCDRLMDLKVDECVPKVNDERKWNSLPGIVHELLSLFKKSEKTNFLATTADIHQKNQKHIFADVEENKLDVLSDTNYEENPLLNIVSENEKDIRSVKNPSNNIECLNFAQSNSCPELDSAELNYSQNLEELDYMINGTVTVFGNAKSTSVENIKENVVEKKNASIGVEEKSLNILPNQNCRDIKISSINVEHSNSIESNGQKKLNTAVLSKLDNESTTLVEYNDVKTIQQEDGSNKKSCFVKELTPNVPENIVLKENLSYPENLKALPKREQLLTILKIQCFNSVSEANIPINKPPPCVCDFCKKVEQLPFNERMVNHLFNDCKLNNQKNYSAIHSDMYESNLTVSDCSECASKGIFTTNNCFCVNQQSSNSLPDKKPLIVETRKQIWVNDLKSMMRKNEEIQGTNIYSKSSLAHQKNTLIKTAKRMINAFCNFCKHSKHYCKCYKKRTNRDKNGFPSYGYHGNYRSSRYY